jgi:hypothetical protein
VSVGNGVYVGSGVRVGRGVQVGVGGGMGVGVRVGVAVGQTSGVAVGVKVGRRVGAGFDDAPASATRSARPAQGPKVIAAKTRPTTTTPFSASSSAISVIHCQGLKLGIFTAATGPSEK